MPATTDFLPVREADLVAWSLNFTERITTTPLAYGLTALQGTDYKALNDAFKAA